jgi:hypothetical protein
MRYVGGLLIWALFLGAMGIEYFAGASLRSASEELYSESMSESRAVPEAPGVLESEARLAPDEEFAGYSAPLDEAEDTGFRPEAAPPKSRIASSRIIRKKSRLR